MRSQFVTNFQHCQVVTATDSHDVAEALAGSAVAARLAASAQVIGPAKSSYWWHDEVVVAEEWRITFRTTFVRYRQLEQHIRDRHNYELPGIVCVPFIAGYEPYLQWLTTQTSQR